MKSFWLLKTEPSVYSIDDLARDGKTCWHGVRNYQARNFMRDQMRIGDEVLIYHSNAHPPAVVGLARVGSDAHPDHTSWDASSEYFDPQSSPEKPRWYMVTVEFVEKLQTPVTLTEIKDHPQLREMIVAQKGIRLSVQPVEAQHFTEITLLGRR